MAVTDTENPLLGETTCSSLLHKLQEIWDEVGENDEERDKMLLQIEKECLDVYKRKVEQAAKSRAQLLQALSDAKIELASLLSALGEKSIAGLGIPEKTSGTIKEQLAAIAPALEQLWKQKEERVKEFSDVQSQIQKICGEIAGNLSLGDQAPSVDESDLTLKKLDEYQAQLQELQKEKSDRLHKVLEFVSTVHDLCGVLGMDFFSTVTEVHPSLNDSTGVQSKSISNDTLARLAKTVLALKEDKKQRLHKKQKVTENSAFNLIPTNDEELGVCVLFSSTFQVRSLLLFGSVAICFHLLAYSLLHLYNFFMFCASDIKYLILPQLQELATQLIDLWNLMDTPSEERRLFDHVTCNISAYVDGVTVPGALALDLIEQAEVEVERLDQLKASRMKEIAFKRQGELEEIFARAHIEIDPVAAREKIMTLIDSGNVEPAELLADMDNQIAKAKEEAHSRKEILDKVEKWMSACEEESWLEDYNRDENRYNASRGAHLNLKRAEKARILVNKIPALVETLVAKTRAWEEDHGISFTYDGVPLLAMLDEYAMLRQEREEEKRRMRESKKFHEQQSSEQESIFGSRPSPARPAGPKKVVGARANGGVNGTPSRRLSLNAHQNGSRSTTKEGKRESTGSIRPAAPVNYVAISKEDSASHVSVSDAVPASP
ncbi:65-kDa microtubule-associated protein 1 [Citrus sinensis]|uniref:65-kDa microtubule-associated protein 1 n=1 Tax=Citrus sinensis TaxID=2711 RepID=A0ACB8P0Q1_CITSI|nr:65-kDa microtubule-associated protein 1 [Citrus sinensis]